MKRKLTEREAWLRLAREWDGAEIEGDEVCVWLCEDGHVCGVFGICPCMDYLRECGLIDKSMYSRMIDKIHVGWRRGGIRTYRWPTTFAGARARAKFCREQAEKLRRKS